MEKYKEIALDIQNKIQEEKLEQDAKLPVLDDLVQQYRVSKATIVKALEILEIRGIIYQRRGSGIFVRRPQKPNYINLIDNFGFKNNLSNLAVNSQILDFQLIASNAELSQILQIDLGSPIYSISRLHFQDDKPFCIEDSYYIQAFTPGIDEEIAQNSIFKYLTESLQLKLGFVDSYLQLEYLTSDQAKLLQQDKQIPCIRFDQTHYLQSGQTLNYSRLYFSSKYGKFSIPTSQFTSI